MVKKKFTKIDIIDGFIKIEIKEPVTLKEIASKLDMVSKKIIEIDKGKDKFNNYIKIS